MRVVGLTLALPCGGFTLTICLSDLFCLACLSYRVNLSSCRSTTPCLSRTVSLDLRAWLRPVATACWRGGLVFIIMQEEEDDELHSLKELLLEKETRIQELGRTVKTSEFKFKLEIKNLAFAEQKANGALSELKEKSLAMQQELQHKKADLQKQTQKNSKLKEQKAELQEEIKKAITHYKEFKEEVRRWERILPSVQFLQHIRVTVETAESYQNLYAANQSLQAKLQKAQQQLQERRKDQEAKDKDFSALQLKSEQTTKDLLERHKRIHQLAQLEALAREQVQVLQGKLHDEREQSNQKQMEIRDLAMQLKESMMQLTEMQEMHQASHNEMINKLNDGLNRADQARQHQIQQLNTHFQERERRMLQSLQKLQQEVMQAQDASADNGTQLQQKNVLIRSLKQQLATSQAQTGRLTIQLKEQEALAMQAEESLLKAQASINTKKGELYNVNIQLRDSQLKLQGVVSQLKTVDQERKALQGRVEQLVKQLGKAAQRSGQIELAQQLTKQLSQTTKQLNQTKQTLQASLQENSKVKENWIKAESEKNELLEKIDLLEMEVSGLKEMLQETRGEQSNAAAQLAKARATLDQLGRRQRLQQQQRAQAQKRQEQSDRQLQTSTAEYDRLKKQSQQLEKQLQAMEKQIQGMQKQALQTKHQNLLETQKLRIQHQQQIDEKERQLRTTRQSNELLEKKLVALKQEFSQLIKKNAKKKTAEQKWQAQPQTQQNAMQTQVLTIQTERAPVEVIQEYQEKSSPRKILRADNSLSIIVNYSKILNSSDSHLSLSSEELLQSTGPSLVQDSRVSDLQRQLDSLKEHFVQQSQQMMSELDYYSHELAVNKVRHAELAIEKEQLKVELIRLKKQMARTRVNHQ